MTPADSSLVTQANQVVESSYKLTLAEKRLILVVLTKIDSHPDKPAARPETLIEIDASEVSAHLHLPQSEAYLMLKEAADRLAERWIIIDRPHPRKPKMKQTKTRWVSAISYIPDEGKVLLRLAEDVLPYLTHLAGEFVRYSIDQVADMSSVYAIRFYELLLQWLGEGQRDVPLDWLREKFALPDSYSNIRDLKRRVVDPAVEQINLHSNLEVSYVQRKRGRIVQSFLFTFGVKQEPKPAPAAKRSPRTNKKAETEARITAAAKPGETREQVIDRLEQLRKLKDAVNAPAPKP
jgi:plasmid replication initiation protein